MLPSQSEQFEFRQESGFWFCPLEGVPYVATIVRNGAAGICSASRF
jgi:hypothetical protein